MLTSLSSLLSALDGALESSNGLYEKALLLRLPTSELQLVRLDEKADRSGDCGESSSSRGRCEVRTGGIRNSADAPGELGDRSAGDCRPGDCGSKLRDTGEGAALKLGESISTLGSCRPELSRI